MRKLIGIMGIILLMSGCARTVTVVGAVGTQITITFRIRETAKPFNRYFVVFGKNAAPQIPFSPNEMVQPQEPTTTTNVDYYSTYYSTWSDYLLIEGQTARLVPGPFTSTSSPEPQAISAFSPTDKQFTITYGLRQMSFGTTIPEQLFIDIVTVDPSKRVVDNLSYNFPIGTVSSVVVSTVSGTIATGTDTDDTSSIQDGSLDIQNYTITIQ